VRFTLWIAFGIIGALTFAFRGSFIYLFGRLEEVPSHLESALEYVPPAVLTAIAIPSILVFEPTVAATVADGRLVAGLIAGGVALRTENLTATVVAGMVTLWALRFGL